MSHHVTKRRHAFTLIELIIVIAIIAAIVAAVFVSLDPARRISIAREARAKQDADQMQRAIELYAVDNQGRWPVQFDGSLCGGTCNPGEVPPGADQTIDICPQGDPPSAACVSLDELVAAGYLPAIPTVQDDDLAPGTTGFIFAYDDGAPQGVSVPDALFDDDNGGAAGGSSSEGPPLITYHRPTSNANTAWNLYNSYTYIDDDVLQPNTLVDGYLIYALNTGPDDDSGETQSYNLDTPARDLTSITVWAYGYRTAASDDATLSVTVGGATTTSSSLNLAIDTPAWRSVTFTGNWSAASVASQFTTNVTAGNIPPGGSDGIAVNALYAEVE
jgi:prepilin-type N-terminal cleavage/methylation domain-containing protein